MRKSMLWGLVAAMLMTAGPAFADDNPCGGKPEAKPEAKEAKDPCAGGAEKAKVAPKKKGKKKPPKDEAPSTEPAPAVDNETEVKAGTGVNRKKRVVVGESETFTAGTKVWIWSAIVGQKGNPVKHVWKMGDRVLFEKQFDATSNRYRTWTRHTVKAGTYTVEVQSESGEVLGSVTFTVS